jgi:hypothetical protein
LVKVEHGCGIVRFYSKEGVKEYLDSLLEYYKERLDLYSQQLSEQLRADVTHSQQQDSSQKDDKKEQKKDKPQKIEKNDNTHRIMRVIGGQGNSSLVPKIVAEIALRVVEYYKSRIEAVSAALKALAEDPVLSQSGAGLYILYINNGVPDTMVIDSMEKPREALTFAGRFKIKPM